MKSLKSAFLLFCCIFSVQSSIHAQVVCVDGFFTNLSKASTLKYIGENHIKDSVSIPKDSAIALLGENYGKNGILIINTPDKISSNSNILRITQNLFPGMRPAIFVDGIEKDPEFDLSKLNKKYIKNIEVLTPLQAVLEKGAKYVGGIVAIEMKK